MRTLGSKMKVIAFAASSSKQSINKQLVTYASGLVENAQVEVLDLNDYELPLFSVDKEQELGKPVLAQEFFAKISASNAVIISFAEHMLKPKYIKNAINYSKTTPQKPTSPQHIYLC
jgi:NAD(P)H-dependent FMN reductase